MFHLLCFQYWRGVLQKTALANVREFECWIVVRAHTILFVIRTQRMRGDVQKTRQCVLYIVQWPMPSFTVSDNHTRGQWVKTLTRTRDEIEVQLYIARRYTASTHMLCLYKILLPLRLLVLSFVDLHCAHSCNVCYEHVGVVLLYVNLIWPLFAGLCTIIFQFIVNREKNAWECVAGNWLRLALMSLRNDLIRNIEDEGV